MADSFPTNKQQRDVNQQRPTRSYLETDKSEEPKSRHAITIGKTPYEVYSFFRDFKNLPLFMKDLQSIRELNENRTHWVVQVKNGAKVEWDAEILQEIPGRMISWRSVEGSEVKTMGSVHFEAAPADRGTVVSLAMDYSVPGGKLTEWFLLFTGETPDFLAITNLKRLKALLETGEVPTVEGQPSGRDEDSHTLKH